MPSINPAKLATETDSPDSTATQDAPEAAPTAPVHLGEIPSVFEVALEIYSRLPPIVQERESQNKCRGVFKRALGFQEGAALMLSGQLQEEFDVDPWYEILDDAFGVNLDADHPMNLVSKSRGSIEGLKQVLQWGKVPESAPEKYRAWIQQFATNIRNRIPEGMLAELGA